MWNNMWLCVYIFPIHRVVPHYDTFILIVCSHNVEPYMTPRIHIQYIALFRILTECATKMCVVTTWNHVWLREYIFNTTRCFAFCHLYFGSAFWQNAQHKCVKSECGTTCDSALMCALRAYTLDCANMYSIQRDIPHSDSYSDIPHSDSYISVPTERATQLYVWECDSAKATCENGAIFRILTWGGYMQ